MRQINRAKIAEIACFLAKTAAVVQTAR